MLTAKERRIDKYIESETKRIAKERREAIEECGSDMLRFVEYIAYQAQTLADSDWSRGTLVLNLKDHAERANRLLSVIDGSDHKAQAVAIRETWGLANYCCDYKHILGITPKGIAVVLVGNRTMNLDRKAFKEIAAELRTARIELTERTVHIYGRTATYFGPGFEFHQIGAE